MANCVVTVASSASHSAVKTAIEAVDDAKFLDTIEVDGVVLIVAKT